jgi:hypothetical protein
MEGQDEFNLLYVAETYHSYGALCYAGSCSMMDDYPGSGETWGTGPATFNTWHIFGDPSLRVVGTAQPPTGMRVSPGSGLTSEGPNGGPFTPDSITYTLTNYETSPIDYSVAKSAVWIDLSDTGGTIPAEGQVLVAVSINSAAEGLADGYYEDTVYFVNETNHDGDTTRVVSLDVGVPVSVIVFSLDTDPGWSTEGEWAFGKATGQGGSSHGNPDPMIGATGNNVYGINLFGDYSTAIGGPYYLTTTAIDCSNLTQVGLHFQRWLNTDYQPYVYATVDVSNDGVNWESLWNNGSSEIADSTWSEHAFDISSVADNEPTVYIRWGHEVGQSGAWAYSGWNIDDVEIWGVAESSPECVGDINGDGFRDFSDFNLLVSAYGSQIGDPEYDPACDLNDDGFVDFSDFNLLSSLYGVPCP